MGPTWGIESKTHHTTSGHSRATSDCGGGCGWLDQEIAQWVQHGELNQRLITQRVATLELHLTVVVGVAGWIKK